MLYMIERQRLDPPRRHVIIIKWQEKLQSENGLWIQLPAKIH